MHPDAGRDAQAPSAPGPTRARSGAGPAGASRRPDPGSRTPRLRRQPRQAKAEPLGDLIGAVALNTNAGAVLIWIMHAVQGEPHPSQQDPGALEDDQENHKNTSIQGRNVRDGQTQVVGEVQVAALP
jgi:hypothetical protein